MYDEHTFADLLCKVLEQRLRILDVVEGKDAPEDLWTVSISL